MRFLFTADWHLSGYLQDKIVKESNLPERLDSNVKVMWQMADYARKNDRKYIIVGGDILHNKSIIYTDAQSVLLDFLRENKDLIFYILDGNHDLGGRGEHPNSALKSLDSESNVIRIKEATKIDNDQIFLVPYSSTMISDIKNNTCKYLLSHFGLHEAQLNSGISLVADIGIKDLKGKYKYVLLGHYHLPQDLISEEIELRYVGSPTQKDWGEKNEIKRFLDVDSETDTIQSILTIGYPKYVELELKKDNSEEIFEQAKLLQKDGHKVKIRKIESFDTKNEEMNFNIIDDVEKDITNRGITSSMTIEDKCKRYMEIKEIRQEDFQPYLNEGLDIIRMCDEKS